MGKIHVVVSGSAADRVVQRVMLGEPIIGLACLGVNVGPKGQISLVVVSTAEGDVFTFDLKRYPDLMYQGLGRLLQSVHVLKVVHDCGPLAANLQTQFGIFITNVFDTQVAYSVMLEQQGLCPRRVPLHALCEKCGIQQYSPSPEFQRLLSEDLNAWARRPLNRDMLNTAAANARPLVPSLYSQLTKVIKGDNWNWFCVLNEKARLSLLHSRPTTIAQSPTNQNKGQRSDKEASRSRSPGPVMRLTLTQRALIKDTIPPAVKG